MNKKTLMYMKYKHMGIEREERYVHTSFQVVELLSCGFLNSKLVVF